MLSDVVSVSGSEMLLDCLKVDVLSDVVSVSGSEMLLDWVCVS